MDNAVMESVGQASLPDIMTSKDACPTPEQDRIVKHIMCKLTAFDAAVKASKLLEIDGVAIDGNACDEVTKESKIKVLNSHNEAAYEVSVDAIVRQPLQDLILALETGLFMRLHGVTRIVGYYSKINNWNKSKISELADRREGNYWDGKRINTEKIAILGE